MNRFSVASLAAALFLAASPALAFTNDNGIIVFTHIDAINGGVRPGDTPGFPVTISVSGSYRLGSNLVATSAFNGIEVRAKKSALIWEALHSPAAARDATASPALTGR